MNLADAMQTFASGYGVPVPIAQAVSTVFTDRNPAFFQFGPHIDRLWDVDNLEPFRSVSHMELSKVFAPDDFPGGSSEWLSQRAYWGPYAQAGYAARAAGYTGSLSSLSADPRTATIYFMRHLASLRDRRPGATWSDVLVEYATGRPVTGLDGVTNHQHYLAKLAKAGAREYL